MGYGDLVGAIRASGAIAGLLDARVDGAAVQGLKGMVTSTMEAGVQINKLRQETGITAENLSVLKYAAGASGVEFEVVAKAGKKLAEAIHDTDTGKLAQGFKMLSISAEQVRSQGSDMYGVMELIADKFASMPDGPVKLAAAVKLFGRSGQEIIPILNQGAAALEKMKAAAPIFSEDDLQRMEKMEHSVNDLDAAWKRLSLTFTEVVATPLTSYLNNLAGGLDVVIGKIREIRGGLSNEEQATADAYAKQYLAAHPEAAPDKGKAEKVQLTEEQIAKQARAAAEMVALQERAAASRKSLVEAIDKSDEVRARTEADTLLDILENQHKRGLVEETTYLAEKAQLQEAAFTAERSMLEKNQNAVESQMETLAAKKPKTDKDRLNMQIQLNALERDLLSIEDKLAEVDERRAKSAREIAQATTDANNAISARIALPEGADNVIPDALRSKAPHVVLDPTNGQIEGEAEKLAHAMFDPLFNFSESWDKRMKQMRANMLRELGQMAESKLFGILFGDPSGRGGKGWDGSSFEGDTSKPGRNGISGAGGLVGEGLSWLFGKHSSPVSNGTGASGAGTVPSQAASALQIGKGVGAAAAGVQVILNNNGTPQAVDSTQSTGDQMEGMVIQIFLKDAATNGQISQAIQQMTTGG